MTPLPMTVIGGYLGAGKTTLINRLLSEPHGLRLCVLVNDFGAVNIDASLIAGQTEDVIALTNGCVCCTMGADLFMALGDVMDLNPRPDHVVIEASGIADPRAIANVAVAEPDLRYAGIVTVIDGMNILDLLSDPLVAPQVRDQIGVADIVFQTKVAHRDAQIDAALEKLGLVQPVLLPQADLGSLLFEAPITNSRLMTGGSHPSYVSWSHTNDITYRQEDVEAALADRPKGLYRVKGTLQTEAGWIEVHAVGAQIQCTPTHAGSASQVVGIGLADSVTEDEIARWWQHKALSGQNLNFRNEV